jgi:hypothetical protein
MSSCGEAPRRTASTLAERQAARAAAAAAAPAPEANRETEGDAPTEVEGDGGGEQETPASAGGGWKKWKAAAVARETARAAACAVEPEPEVVPERTGRPTRSKRRHQREHKVSRKQARKDAETLNTAKEEAALYVPIASPHSAPSFDTLRTYRRRTATNITLSRPYVCRVRDPAEAAQREAGIQMFRTYYKLMGVLPDDEFELFMKCLFQPLPVSFRVRPPDNFLPPQHRVVWHGLRWTAATSGCTDGRTSSPCSSEATEVGPGNPSEPRLVR